MSTCQVKEVYSVFNAVKIVIESYQKTGEITGPNGMQLLVPLMTDTLEPTSPLTVKHVPLVGQKEGDCPRREERRPEDLTETGKATGLAFHAATAKRIVEPR